MPGSGEVRIEDLWGTWKLVSMQRKIVETGDIVDLNSANPFGFLTYSSDGRMMVLNIVGQRPKPHSLETITDGQRAQLFRTMVSYSGTYTLEGQLVFHHIDISWNECWTGTTQVRKVCRSDDKLVLETTTPGPGGLDGKMGIARLLWARVGGRGQHRSEADGPRAPMTSSLLSDEGTKR